MTASTGHASLPATPPSPQAAAAQAWSVLAPLLAGRPRVRESRNGGHAYLRRWERPLTARLPAVPAAVPIYSAAGDTRVLVVDLDASRGGVGRGAPGRRRGPRPGPGGRRPGHHR